MNLLHHDNTHPQLSPVPILNVRNSTGHPLPSGMRVVVVATELISSLGAPPRSSRNHPTLRPKPPKVKAPRAFVTLGRIIIVIIIIVQNHSFINNSVALRLQGSRISPVTSHSLHICRYFGRPKFYWSTCINLGWARINTSSSSQPASQPLRLTRICTAFGCLSNRVPRLAALSSVSVATTHPAGGSIFCSSLAASYSSHSLALSLSCWWLSLQACLVILSHASLASLMMAHAAFCSLLRVRACRAASRAILLGN
ncbi:hypothetical protein IWX49DRAFT_366818 [Phyllosticta citricarpa]|uniref:Uncharacterized protein n=2 Tax=Phyllosticta TaxID=121621 RepID=A0ABR1MJ61_9PEZI